MRFSVLMSVYAKENPRFLSESLESILNQSLPPDEIVVVKDGPLGEGLELVLAEFQSRLKTDVFKILSLPQNRGLGLALQFGLEHTTHNIVARMDSDDIAAPDRFQRQISFLQQNTEYDVVGSTILEFNTSPNQSLRLREVCESHEEIYEMAARQNPLNHMTVVFNKRKVQEAGGYLDVPFFEDYHLWVRMLAMGNKFYNLREPLVSARVGNDMIGKRHGLSYCRHEFNFFKRIYELGFLKRQGLIKILLMRLPLRILPKPLLSLIYHFILRKNRI